MTTATKKPKPTTIATAAELARLTHRSKAAVSAWRRRSDWRFGGPPWQMTQLQEIKTYVAGLRPGGGREVDAERESLRQTKLTAEIRKLRAQANYEESKLEKLCASLTDAAEAKAEWVKLTTTINAALDDMKPKILRLALNQKIPPETSADFAAGVAALLDAAGARMNPTTGDLSPEDDDDC